MQIGNIFVSRQNKTSMKISVTWLKLWLMHWHWTEWAGFGASARVEVNASADMDQCCTDPWAKLENKSSTLTEIIQLLTWEYYTTFREQCIDLSLQRMQCCKHHLYCQFVCLFRRYCTKWRLHFGKFPAFPI